MKKIFFILSIILCSVSANIQAQQGYKAVHVAGGYTWQKGGDIYLGLDFPSDSFNSFEIFARSFFHRKETNYLGGLAYKYCFNKGINSAFRGKIAGVAGTTTHEAIFGGILGFEYIYAISPSIDFMIIPEGGYYFNSAQKWRVTTMAGLRFNF